MTIQMEVQERQERQERQKSQERIVIPELEGEHRIFIIYLNPPHEFTGE